MTDFEYRKEESGAVGCFIFWLESFTKTQTIGMELTKGGGQEFLSGNRHGALEDPGEAVQPEIGFDHGVAKDINLG